MTTQELVDYCLSIAAETAVDATGSPLLDQEQVLETLLPAVIREAARDAYKRQPETCALVEPHLLELTRGQADLPEGVEEEFSLSFQCGDPEPKVRRVLAANYNSFSLEIDLLNGEGFEADDVSRYVRFVDADGIERLYAPISFAAGATAVPYTGPPVVGNYLNGTLTIYETEWVPVKGLGDVSSVATQKDIVDNAIVGGFAASDEGLMIEISDGASDTFRGFIDVVTDAHNIDLFSEAPLTITNGTAAIYREATLAETPMDKLAVKRTDRYSRASNNNDLDREADGLPRFYAGRGRIEVKTSRGICPADGTTIALYAVTLPQLPAAAVQIPAPEQFLDEVMLIAAAVLRGERQLVEIDLSKAA